MFQETYQAIDHSSFQSPLGPGGLLVAPQGAHAPVDPPITFIEPSWPKLVPALILPSHTPKAVIGSSSSNEGDDRFANTPSVMMGADPPSTWANPQAWHGNTSAEGGETNNITISSLRIRGKRSAPQTYQGDVERLYDRLMGEGADINAAILLRYFIFAEGVTVDALMAPAQTNDVFHACNGAKKMWEMLLETKEAMPGKKKYCCLLCPVENRREYQDSRDAIRHFNRDHFGFSFPCEYW